MKRRHHDRQFAGRNQFVNRSAPPARGFSRRNFLKGTATGLAGMALFPALRAGPPVGGLGNSDGVDSLWDHALPAGYTLFDFPVANNGANGGVIQLALQNSEQSIGAYLWVDVQSRQPLKMFTFPSLFLESPFRLDANTFLTSDSSGSVFEVSAVDGSYFPTQEQIATNIVPAYGGYCYVRKDASLFLYTPNVSWATELADSVNLATDPLVLEDRIVVCLDKTVYAVDTSGNLLWSQTLAGNVYGSLTSDSNSVYFSIADDAANTYQVVSLDLATGNEKWHWPNTTLGNQISAPAVNGDTVYAADWSGVFHALNTKDGSQAWSIQLSAGSFGRMFIEDGVAYIASQHFSAGTATLYAIDLAAQKTLSLTADWNSDFLGVENGIAYYVHNNYGNIAAVNFAGQLHQYFCESELMVEDYVASPSGGPQGSTTSYRTHLSMLDANFNPRVGKSVKVWASGPATLTSGGQTWNIGTSGQNTPANSAYLQTDGGGELALVVTATDLSCPALYIWGNFMDDNECLVVYPDHDSLGQLNQTNGGVLTQATCYDGTPMLPTGYSSADHLASTITSTMGGGTTIAMALAQQENQQKATEKALRRGARPGCRHLRPLRCPPPPHHPGSGGHNPGGPGNPGGPPTGVENTSFIAYPDSTPNMIHQPTIDVSDRPYGTPTVPNWSATFDTDGGVVYSVTTPQQLQHGHGGVGRTGGGNPGATGSLGIDDLLKNVVHGAEKLATIVYTTVANEVTAVLTTVEHTYNIAISAVEHAAAVVAATLKTVIGDIKKAIQWLSYLFNWTDILATKDNIKNAVLTNLDNVSTWINAQVADGFGSLHAGLRALSPKSSLMTGQNTPEAGGSMQSKQNDNNNPQTSYGACPQPQPNPPQPCSKSYTKTRYLSSKFNDNAGKGQVLGLTVSSAQDDFVTAVESFFNTAKQTLEQDPNYQKIPDDLKAFFTNFSKLFTDPSQFVTNSLTDIIQLMTDIADTLVAFTDAVIEAFLGMLTNVIQYFKSALQTQIDIPVVSDLWKLISGGAALTFLDLISLIVAVPTTIVEKVVGGLQEDAQGDPILDQKYGFWFVLGLQTFAVPIGDIAGPDFGPFYTKFLASLSVVSLGLALPSDFAKNTAYTYSFYCLKLLPVTLSLYNATAGNTPVSALIKQVIPFGVCAYGVIDFVLSVVFAVLDEEGFRGKDYLNMLQNVFQSLPSICKPLSTGPGGTFNRACAAVIDMASFGTALGISVSLTLD